MSDLKITQLTADTTPQGADLLTSVKSPFGVGSNRKMTVSNFMQQQTIDWQTTGKIALGASGVLSSHKIIDAQQTFTDFSTTNNSGFNLFTIATPSANTIHAVYGDNISVVFSGTHNIGNIYGQNIEITHVAAASAVSIIGQNINIDLSLGTSSSAQSMYGAIYNVECDENTPLTNLEGISISLISGGNVTKAAGIHINAPSFSGGIITESDGILIDDQGSTRNAIKTGTGLITFGDIVQINKATGYLDLSLISAGNPNLKITKTSDTPSTTWTAGVPSNNPSGYIEITESGGSKYIPFWV